MRLNSFLHLLLGMLVPTGAMADAIRGSGVRARKVVRHALELHAHGVHLQSPEHLPQLGVDLPTHRLKYLGPQLHLWPSDLRIRQRKATRRHRDKNKLGLVDLGPKLIMSAVDDQLIDPPLMQHRPGACL